MKWTPLEHDDPRAIGRYRVLGVIGAGGMGRVLLGVGPDGRPVAIKLIRADLVADPESRARFGREVHASARVSGAFTAAVVDADVDGETPWLASLFVPGVPLDIAVSEQGRFGPDATRMLAAGLASALREIHRRGLVHRDLKPGNVILAADGPKVIDFGIARAYEGGAQLTQTGSVLGSPAYMSPEQADSSPLTPASDIFALGSVLVTAATGRAPFTGVSVPNLLYNIVFGEPELSEVPPELRSLLAWCLRKEPGERPTPEQVLDHLHPLPIAVRPWSPQLHRMIDEQERGLRDLLADPNATMIRPRHAEKVSDARVFARGSGNRRRAPVATGALAAIMMLIAAVIVVARDGGGGGGIAPNPLAPLSLAGLRTIDPCAVLKQALSPLPDSAEFKPSSWEQCTVKRGETDWVRIEFADAGRFHDSGRTVDGVPVLESPGPSADECGRALRPATASPQVGIVVTVSGGCAGLDTVLPGVVASLRAAPPQFPDARSTLAVLDVCAALDQVTVDRVLGAGATPAPTAPHVCSWRNSNLLYVRARLGGPVDGPQYRPVDLGGGMTVYGTATEGTPCHRHYQHRTRGANQAEVVEVALSKGNIPTSCAAADDIMRTLIPSLS
ncbi:protein kinase [Nocardia sp. NPDC127579]|uniref:serine/threonine-protein kinase n=1 Tax=Nocardia sp. NPDC127579 TaxID=3345402 RepID=UPI0036378CA4